MTLQLVIFSIVNLALSLIGLVCMLGIIFGSITTIIMAIIEGTAPVSPNQKRSWKKTIIAGSIAASCVLLQIFIMVSWTFVSILFSLV